MRKLWVTSFLIIVVNSSQLTAQVPGYLGKKLSLLLEPSFNIGYKSNFRNLNPPGFYPRVRYGADIDYVISRISSVGVSYEYYQTGLALRSPETNKMVHGRIQGNGVGAYIKFHPFTRRGNIAPLGPYTKLEHVFLFYSLSEKEGLYQADGSTGKIANYYTSVLLLSFGHNYLLWDMMFLSYGVQGGFVIGMLNNPSSAYPMNPGPRLHDRLASYFAVNLNLGMGVLLF